MTAAFSTQTDLMLAGSWPDEQLRSAQAFAGRQRELLDERETVELVKPELLALDRAALDRKAFADAIKQLRDPMLKSLSPISAPAARSGWQALGLLGRGEPSFDQLDGNLVTNTHYSIVLVPGPEAPDLRLEAACIAHERLPLLPCLFPFNEDGSLNPQDMRVSVVGFLPVWIADSDYRKFVLTLSKMLLRAFQSDFSALLSKLWLATVEYGVLKEGNHYLVYGRRLLANPALALRTVQGTTRLRKPLTVAELKRAKIGQLETQTQQSPSFFITSFTQLEQVLKDCLA